MSGYSQILKRIQMRLQLHLFPLKLYVEVRNGIIIMYCHRRGLFYFLWSIKNTDPSWQIEMNWQLNCLPPCHLSLFVSCFLLISLTNSIIHSNSHFSSLLLCKSISHISATSGQLRQHKKIPS